MGLRISQPGCREKESAALGRSSSPHLSGAHPIPDPTRPPHPCRSFLLKQVQVSEPASHPEPQSILTHMLAGKSQRSPAPRWKGILQPSQGGGADGATGAPNSRDTPTESGAWMVLLHKQCRSPVCERENEYIMPVCPVMFDVYIYAR